MACEFAGEAPPGLTRTVTGGGAEFPIVKISGRFVQDLAARPGDPRAYVSAGDFVARVRELFLSEISVLEEALAEKEVLGKFPFLISDMRAAVAQANLHGEDGKHVSPETSGAELADFIGAAEVVYVCVDDRGHP